MSLMNSNIGGVDDITVFNVILGLKYCTKLYENYKCVHIGYKS